jgi:hypothetical protein
VEGKRRTMNGMNIVLMFQKRNLLKVFHDEDDINAIIENIKILYTLKKMKKEGEAMEGKRRRECEASEAQGLRLGQGKPFEVKNCIKTHTHIYIY